ncbi:uncharacterized protein LOC122944427 isoform X1 [Bufo gargarizans]|uniref:uncharacterized protein LOC122944427 isoform X1 n=1 Tax=Bufo gargarizans TaxID=30331 RepID=UPI001CF53E45|nr:uncharacterized protein LOC122944427 isoform X1 [Bufo gargarizans]
MGARQSSDGAADDCPITPPPSQAAPSAPLSLPLAALVASPPPPPVAGDMSGGRSPTIGVSPFVSGSSASDPAPPPPLSHIPFIPFAAAPAVGRGRRRERSLSPTSSREGRRRGRRSRRRRRSSRHSRSSRYSRRSRSSRWRSPSSSEGSSGVSEESVRTPRSGSGRLADGEVSRVSSLASVAVHREAVPVPAVVPAAIPVPGFSGPSSGGGDGWAGLPRFPVAAGAQQLMTLVSSSVTPATWQAHGKAWAEWLVVRGSRDVASRDDVRLEVTVEWLLGMRERGVSAPVARRKLAGVAFYFKLYGWPDVTKMFLIRQAMKGWQKEYVGYDSRRPISFSLLGRLVDVCRVVCFSDFERALVAACFGVAFFAALRVGELVAPSASRNGGLLVSDVILSNNALRVRVRCSKTDQLGKGVWLPILPVASGACPVKLVGEYMSLRVSGGNFFAHADGSPLTKFQFASVLRKCLAQLGFDPGEFGTHSFRIGAATEAARAGLSESEVMRIGRWRSACFARYVRPELLVD